MYHNRKQIENCLLLTSLISVADNIHIVDLTYIRNAVPN